MATGLSVDISNALLDQLLATAWAQLHTGDPGANGDSNIAGETARQQATMLVASGGSTSNDNDIVWLSVSNTETYSYLSLWTDETAGDFLASKALTASRAVTAGDDFQIDSGDLQVSLGPVAT